MAGCLTDHHGTSSRYEDDFQINSNLNFFRKQQMSAVAVGGCGDETRQDVEQGSILPAKAKKLLSLHGPSN